MPLRAVLFAACCLAVVLVAGDARAQEADSLVVEHPPDRVSAAAAVGIEYLVPTLGHAYAGDWGRGVPPFIVSLMGGAIAVASVAGCGCLDSSGVDAGLATLLIGRLWGLYSAYQTAEDHNDALVPSLSFGPARETLGVRVVVGL